MKLIIDKIDRKNKTFFSIVDGKKTGFYLTNRLAKIFFDSLDQGILVDFDAIDLTKKINGYKCYQVSHFNKIVNLKYKIETYSHETLKKDMVEFLVENDHYLFLDLEMTIPYPRQKGFKPEIIQYGYFLTNKIGEVLKEGSNYLLTVKQVPVSKRTFRFLTINEEIFYNQAVSHSIFYDDLKSIIEVYNPKIVVWGKNDIIALNHSYEIYSTKSLTNKNSFVDLLKLHKDYFNLKNDVGLFKAYQTYYDQSFEQVHDAKDDAKVTKKVFDAFLDYSLRETEKTK